MVEEVDVALVSASHRGLPKCVHYGIPMKPIKNGNGDKGKRNEYITT